MSTRDDLIARADRAHSGHGTHTPWEQYQLGVMKRRVWRYGVMHVEKGEQVLVRVDGDEVWVYSNRLLMEFRTDLDHVRPV